MQQADSTVAIKDEAPDHDAGDPPGTKMDDWPTTTLQPNCDSLDDFMGRQVKRLMREEDASSGLSSRLPLPLLPLPRHEVMTSPETAVRLRGNSSRQQVGISLEMFDFGRFFWAIS